MQESDLLRHIFDRSRTLAARYPQVVVGPGHDCAVVASGSPVLLKVDQLVAGRHFRDGTPIDLIARKAVARAVSDIAATGGTPLAALAAATLPNQYPHANALFDAMAKWAEHFGCPLVGGDIASSDAPGSPLVLSVSIIGSPHVSRGPVLRSGAKPGDGVFITGAIGGSFDPGTGLGWHLTFTPRLEEAKFLCDTLGPQLHAMMDVSDGLGRDAGRMAAMSGVAIELQEDLLPLRVPGSSWRSALGDGEDYELLLAAAGDVPPLCPTTGVPLTRIGTVREGSGTVLLQRDGSRIDVANLGWDHGKSAPRV